MEALRQAEEAKRKDSEKSGVESKKRPQEDDPVQEESAGELGLDVEQPLAEPEVESKDLQTDFDAALAEESDIQTDALEWEIDSDSSNLDATAEVDDDQESSVSDQPKATDDSWSDLDLHPMQVEIAEASEPVDQEPSSDSVDIAEPPVETDLHQSSSTPGDTAPSSDKASAQSLDKLFTGETSGSEDSSAAGIAEEHPKELDEAEVAAWKSRAKKLTSSRDYRRVALVALILIFFIGGGLFWYFGSDPAPTVAPVAQDRGFLGGPEPLELSALDEPVTVELGETQTGGNDLENQVPAVISTSQIASTEDGFVIGGALGDELQADSVGFQTGLSIAETSQTEVFSISPATQSSELDSLRREAASAAQAGYRAHAREQYEWLLTAEPNNTEALIGLARLDSEAGNLQAARQGYLRLLELDPANPVAQAGLLESSQAGDPLSREAALITLRSQHPDIAALPYALGNLFASQQRWHEAEGAYASALATAKSSGSQLVSPDFSFNLAVALEQLRKPEQAYTYYLEALESSKSIAPSFDLETLNQRIAHLGQRL